MAPRPPFITPRARHHQEALTPQKARFFHAVDQARESKKSMIKVLKEEGIARITGYKWLH